MYGQYKYTAGDIRHKLTTFNFFFYLMCPPEECPATEAAYPAVAQLSRCLAAHGAATDGTRAALDDPDNFLVHFGANHLFAPHTILFVSLVTLLHIPECGQNPLSHSNYCILFSYLFACSILQDCLV